MANSLFSSTDHGERVHHPDRLRWTEETFLDLPGGNEETPPSSFVGVFFLRNRIRGFFFFITLVLLFFIIRVGFLQLFSGASYAAIAEKNRLRIDIERASRGLLLDRDGRPLVKNKPEFILTVTPYTLPKKEEERKKLLGHLSTVLYEPILKLTEDLSGLPKDPLLQRQAISFRENLSYATALRLMVEEEKLEGFRVEIREQRAYPETYDENGTELPMPQTLAHIVGYLGKIHPEEWPERQARGYLLSDLLGQNGLEAFYDQELHGIHGKTFTEIDALGNEKQIIRREEATSGKTLRLTIDLSLQRILEEKIQKALLKLPTRTRRGAVGIGLDPRNGAIRALVSLPTFSPRIFSSPRRAETIKELFSDPDQPLFLRAIAGEYPSGSTIKPLMALAALEEGIITKHTSILSAGGIQIGQWFFPDWLAGGHGETSVRRAIAESINTFFYVIGGGYGNIPGLGPERIEQWLKKFSFGTPLGVDLPREATGLVPTPEWKKEKKGERWYIGDTYHLAIGQGDILVSPLQIAAMTAAFANGATLWQPHLVEQESPKKILESLGGEENVRTIREGLRMAVTNGSARRLSLLPFSSAGKTGTAEWSSTRPPHAWFTGFAPYEQPELVLTILIEEGGGGEATAAPIAEEVFREYFSLKNALSTKGR